MPLRTSGQRRAAPVGRVTTSGASRLASSRVSAERSAGFIPASRGAVHARGDLHRPVAVAVRVHDDVGAGLGDGQLDVREDLRVELERLAEATEGMPHDRDVLGSSRQG